MAQANPKSALLRAAIAAACLGATGPLALADGHPSDGDLTRFVFSVKCGC